MMGLHEVELLAGLARRAREERAPRGVIGRLLCYVAVHGSERVADVGCGNGGYLAELACRGYAGPVLGIDLSAGMLAAARPGGRVLVVLNGADHLRELRDLITAALAGVTGRQPPRRQRLRMDDGQALLASEFVPSPGTTSPPSCSSPRTGPVRDYVRSMSVTQGPA